MKKILVILTVVSISFLLAACGNEESQENTEDKVENEQDLTEENNTDAPKNTDDTATIANHDFFEEHKGNLDHVHGIGYAGNQNAIFFASHDGLKVFENGKWFKTKGQNNDYMGFNAVDVGFYTSGHPGEGVDMPNPLGLKRSLDNGQTLEDLGLEGESDFHAMGVGYKNHTIYVLNGHKNSMMDEGLYVSKDDGKSWSEIKAEQLGEKIFSIAVHPTNDELVAVSGQKGVFLSRDGGQNFSLLTENRQGTATFFSEDALWYGAYGHEPVLVKYVLEGAEKKELALPNMKEDAPMYFAQNPKNESELVFISFKGSIYLSRDSGESWEILVDEGKIQ